MKKGWKILLCVLAFFMLADLVYRAFFYRPTELVVSARFPGSRYQGATRIMAIICPTTTVTGRSAFVRLKRSASRKACTARRTVRQE